MEIPSRTVISTKYVDQIGRNFKIHAWKEFTGKEKEEREK